MSVYKEILNWSLDKSMFIRDALRRLIVTNQILTEKDIDELILLLKKDCGDPAIKLEAIPFNEEHLPNETITSNSYPKLISLANPKNICALYENGVLEFAEKGLTIVYGNNGSGKSSYARILKKFCWSRSANTELKKNVFNLSNTPQEVNFVLKNDEQKISYIWSERTNEEAHTLLKSIFVFDNDCSNVYINKENPIEYNPIGIDLLKRLIQTFDLITSKIQNEINSLIVKKPILNEKLIDSDRSKWYNTIEQLKKEEINSNILFTKEEEIEKDNLTKLLKEKDPQKEITFLSNQKTRISNFLGEIKEIESFFAESRKDNIEKLINSYDEVYRAYEIAKLELNEVTILEGLGSNPWRTLWESAKKYADSIHLTNTDNYPSGKSLERCVLCQQELGNEAKKRLLTFKKFIHDDISEELGTLQKKIQEKEKFYKDLKIPVISHFTELEQLIPEFKEIYNKFTSTIEMNKKEIITFLDEGGELNLILFNISQYIEKIISDIDGKIEENKSSITNREKLISKAKELYTKEFLFKEKDNILRYFDEYNIKKILKSCLSKLNTRSISMMIGNLMENKAVKLQQDEFISHLKSINQELANKVSISKVHTNQGVTYQKCKFNEIQEDISSVLSEGEQKVIAISNFLSECTIDNRLNTIIFDDPVTSLDVDFRESIAKKIVELSKNRQVIVLTHDLYFLRLLLDKSKEMGLSDCNITGINKEEGISGIVSNEIPYLAKNVQERIDDIKADICNINRFDTRDRECSLNSIRKKFRMLLERTIEEILSGKSYERFSKNIKVKRDNLLSYVVVNEDDINFILELFGKYSVTEHDGGIEIIPSLPNAETIENDIGIYHKWKEEFKARVKDLK